MLSNTSAADGARRRLPNRRHSTTREIEARGLKFTATTSKDRDGRLAEVFLQNHKLGSDAGILASDAAVICSLALQYGVPLDVIRKALMRDAAGRATSPIGLILDLVAKED